MRTLWYRHNSLIAENEAAVDIESLKGDCESLFKFKMEKAHRRPGLSAGLKLDDLSRPAVAEKNLFAGAHVIGKNARWFSLAYFLVGGAVSVGKEMKAESSPKGCKIVAGGRSEA